MSFDFGNAHVVVMCYGQPKTSMISFENMFVLNIRKMEFWIYRRIQK